jgi:hypothetical protein
MVRKMKKRNIREYKNGIKKKERKDVKCKERRKRGRNDEMEIVDGENEQFLKDEGYHCIHCILTVCFGA